MTIRKHSKHITSPAIEIQAGRQLPLGMPVKKFMDVYWQKQPLLIRGAFPDYQTPVTPEDLAGLACEEMALSRLIQHNRKNDTWAVTHGPFQESDFPGLGDRDWTLLVQDVDKWDQDIAELLSAFDFLPRWRIDDIMISFAATGGSVGAHIDQYDVFLLQGYGHRRWQIDTSAQPDLTFRNDVELKMLKTFKPNHEWILAPGDMLYLPPGVPHHGIAEDPCLTFSVGMRAPSAAELLGDFVDTLAAGADESQRYIDPDLQPARDPNEIDDQAMDRAITALNMLRMRDPKRLSDWFGRFITQYRSANAVMPYMHAINLDDIAARMAAGEQLMRYPWTRMAWRKQNPKLTHLYVAGDVYPMSANEAKLLAANACIGQAIFNRLTDKGRTALVEIMQAGHYQWQSDEINASDDSEEYSDD